MGIMQLSCDKTLRGYMYKHTSSPGINEEHLLESAKRFAAFKAQRVGEGMRPPPSPIDEGVLIFDEVKVCLQFLWRDLTSDFDVIVTSHAHLLLRPAFFILL